MGLKNSSSCLQLSDSREEDESNVDVQVSTGLNMVCVVQKLLDSRKLWVKTLIELIQHVGLAANTC